MKQFRACLVIAFAFQLFSVQGLCLLTEGCGRDCCVPFQDSEETGSGPIPDCCIPSVLRAHASVAEVQGKQVPERPLIATVRLDRPEFGRRVETHALTVEPQSQAIPPPLSPRLQTCLLLI